jgi:hypothetical protein
MAKMSTVAKKGKYTTVEVAGHEVRLSNPDKLFFPKPGFTKLDLAEYYIAVEEAAVNQLRERPGTMKRFVDGVDGEFFFQKRVPKGAPNWLQTATFTRTGLTEIRHAASKRSFVAEMRRFLPELGVGDVLPGPAGIRAQALDRDGRLVDDFVVHRTERALHVRNAPSPAATSSLALAKLIADEADAELG